MVGVVVMDPNGPSRSPEPTTLADLARTLNVRLIRRACLDGPRDPRVCQPQGLVSDS